MPWLRFFQSLEKGVGGGTELASDAGNTTSRRGCAGVLVITFLLINIAKSGDAPDRVRSAGRGRSRGFHGLLSGNSGVFISGVGLDAMALAEKRPLIKGLIEPEFSPPTDSAFPLRRYTNSRFG